MHNECSKGSNKNFVLLTEAKYHICYTSFQSRSTAKCDVETGYRNVDYGGPIKHGASDCQASQLSSLLSPWCFIPGQDWYQFINTKVTNGLADHITTNVRESNTLPGNGYSGVPTTNLTRSYQPQTTDN